jgi:urea carboxylase
MGLKHEARSAAINAGVPVLAGTALLTTLEDALEQARAIGFPVMLKASAGGGGMGMEVCESEEELEVNFEKTVGKALVRFLSCCFTLAALVKTACHLLFVWHLLSSTCSARLQALFSNAGVFLEKYIRRARHIEVQVFGDGEGKVMEFGEREVSFSPFDLLWLSLFSSWLWGFCTPSSL